MKKQTILFTALPNALDAAPAPGSKLKLSVFISPRLWNSDAAVASMNLSEFPDFLDWPSVANTAAFQVTFSGGTTLSATRTSPAARSDLWQALFNAATRVKPYAFEDLTGAQVVTFPSAQILDVIQSVYQRAASDPAYGAGADLPSVETWDSDPDLTEIAPPTRPPVEYDPGQMDIGPVRVERPPDFVEEEPAQPEKPCGCLCALWRWLVKLVKKIFGVPGQAQPAGSQPAPAARTPVLPAAASATAGPASEPQVVERAASPKLAAFDDLQAYVAVQPGLAASNLPTQAQIDQKYDFHAMISALGDYPALLRLVGLVVDLEVTLSAPLPAAQGTLQAIPTLNLSLPTTPYTPRTHYELGSTFFRTRPRPGSDLNAGLLRLNDSSRFRLVQAEIAGSGLKLRNMATIQRGWRDHTRRPANRPKNEGLPALQTLGLSVVRPQLGAQLKERFGRAYALNRALALVDASPAPAPAGGSAPAASDELYAEDVRRGYRLDVYDDRAKTWHSLCQRIGRYRFLDLPGDPLPLEDEGFVQMGVTEDLSPAPGPRRLKAHEALFTWDGWSLVAPRPGKIILADDTQVGAQSNTAATPFHLETEFKPKPGSLPRLRFGYSYRLRARAVDLAGNSVFQPGDPAFQQDQAEISALHPFQRFEPASPPALLLKAAPKEGESLETLVVRSAHDSIPADPAESQTERHLIPPKVSQAFVERHGKFDQAPGMKKDPAGYQLASREASTLTHRWDQTLQAFVQLAGVQELTTPEHTFWLQAGDTHEVAYLPDPAARGVLLLGLPGMSSFEEVIEPVGAPVNKIPFGGAWPDPTPFRLRLEGIPRAQLPNPPAWDGTARLLTVQIPQAARLSVRISCYMLAQDLENQAVYQWMRQSNPANLAELEKQAKAGRAWLYMPYRELLLIHAVQQPQAIPELLNLHVAPHPAIPGSQMRTLGDTTAPLAGKLKVDARSTGKVDLHAAWSDPFDDPAKDTFTPGTDALSYQMYVGQVAVNSPEQDALSIDGLVHGIGDTKFHRIRYHAVAATRFREFFDQTNPAIASNLVRPTAAEAATPAAAVAQKEALVFNTSRPAAARPLSPLPTFTWDESRSANLITRRRHSSGLRIYLQRPWFSSGADELLGLLLRPGAIAPTSPEMETINKYTSEWGMDPLWKGEATAPLALGDFSAPAVTRSGLSIPEGKWLLDVAGYPVTFDPLRKLWFCDVLLDPQRAYFPFVRLALARFQPNSIPHAHLSAVTLSDFCQVVPHRTLTYDTSFLQSANREIRIQMRGPAYWHRQWEAYGSPLVQAVLLRGRHSQMHGDLDWEIVPGSPRMLEVVQRDPAETVWQGSLVAPDPLPDPLRVAVLEYELYKQVVGDQASSGESLASLTHLASQASEQAVGGMVIMPPVSAGARLTFFDAVTL